MNLDRQVDNNARTSDEPWTTPIYDDTAWPIFIVRMPPTELSSEAFEAHLAACRKPFRSAQSFCMLINMGNHPPLSAAHRKASAEAMKADMARYPGLSAGLAIVVHSKITRGVVTAISWLVKPPYPFAAFEKETDAIVWLRAQLAQHRSAVRVD